MKTLYIAKVTATGGRNGHVKSDDNVLDLDVRVPKEMGGANNDHTNPEQLFAAGYSACFGSALEMLISKENIEAGTPTITAKVSIGQIENGGYQLAVELVVNIPQASLEQAQDLAEQAHQICPYSNATRGNIDVIITATND